MCASMRPSLEIPTLIYKGFLARKSRFSTAEGGRIGEVGLRADPAQQSHQFQ